jgi:hypothetical protein
MIFTYFQSGLARPALVAQSTYTARSAWTYPFKSTQPRLLKFQTLSRLSWQQLAEARSVLRTTSAECGIELRAPEYFGIPKLAGTLRFALADLQSPFRVRSNHEVILDSASRITQSVIEPCATPLDSIKTSLRHPVSRLF